MAGSASGVALWIQYPVGLSAVTTPRTPLTGLPLYGDVCLAPWIWWIVSGSSTGGMRVQAGLSTVLFSGDGSVARKSVALSSVSVQGAFRVAEVVLARAGLGFPPRGRQCRSRPCR